MSRAGIGLIALLWALQAGAAPANLDELLQQVLTGREAQRAENAARERRFIEARDQQRELLAAAGAVLAKEQARSDALRAEYERNQAALSQQSEALSQATGDLGELHGVTRQIAGDLKGVVAGSLLSAQDPTRGEGLQALATSRELPSIKALEGLWYLTLSEMVGSSKVVRFKAKVAATDGTEADTEVTRIGAFNLISGGRYLRHLPDTGQIVMPSGQPSARYLALAEALEESTEGVHMMALDPTRGALLALLMQSPGFIERIQQAGAIGYVILALGAVALVFVIERMVVLGRLRRRMQQQKEARQAQSDNPLGRLRIIEQDNPADDPETLGLKLDQGVMQEVPRLRRLLPALAVCATAAPLLGLLGTVAGMIETFQSMTLFGAGDPKLVAGGISMALVATELGLLVAIPILLLHSWLHGTSNALMHSLDEEVAAIVARRDAALR
jgi:biopolymer transport protein ExbB